MFWKNKGMYKLLKSTFLFIITHAATFFLTSTPQPKILFCIIYYSVLLNKISTLLLGLLLGS